MAYTKTTDFAAKDALLTGDPNKIVRGTEIDAEFDAIETADGDNVKGPASSTDNAIARFDGTTGKLVQNSAVTVADTTGDITGGKYNKITVTAPASGATLTLSDGSSLITSGGHSITLTSTGATNVTLPTSGTLITGVPDGSVTTAKLAAGVANDLTAVTVASSDYIVIADTSDSGNVKKGLVSDVLSLADSITLDTPQATTSGTSKDFVIPSGTKRITVMFSGVSTNSTDRLRIQIGDSGGIETTGYDGTCSYIASASAASASLSAGFDIPNGEVSSATHHGMLTLCLLDSSTNLWVAQGISGNGAAGYSGYVSGSKSLTSELTTVTVKGSVGGTFDAGSVNVMYE